MSIIDDLKANEKPFGLMSEEMQDKAKAIGREEFDVYMSHGWDNRCGNDFGKCSTYRLRPDYAEEPPAEVTISRVALEAIIEIAQKALKPGHLSRACHQVILRTL